MVTVTKAKTYLSCFNRFWDIHFNRTKLSRGVIKSTKSPLPPPPIIDNAKNVKWVLNTKNLQNMIHHY